MLGEQQDMCSSCRAAVTFPDVSLCLLIVLVALQLWNAEEKGER